jgi:hypothetical protein
MQADDLQGVPRQQSAMQVFWVPLPHFGIKGVGEAEQADSVAGFPI